VSQTPKILKGGKGDRHGLGWCPNSDETTGRGKRTYEANGCTTTIKRGGKNKGRASKDKLYLSGMTEEKRGCSQVRGGDPEEEELLKILGRISGGNLKRSDCSGAKKDKKYTGTFKKGGKNLKMGDGTIPQSTRGEDQTSNYLRAARSLVRGFGHRGRHTVGRGN